MSPLLYVIADRATVPSDDDWLHRLEGVCAALSWRHAVVSLRPGAPAAGRDRALQRARSITAAAGVSAVLNASTAEALAYGFAGVHWSQVAVPAANAPVPPGFLRVAAVHDLAGVIRAQGAGADRLVYAPVFDPISKPGIGRGLAALSEVCRAAVAPVIALGGITPARVRPCIAAGAGGVAALGGLFGAGDPAAAAGDYLAAIEATKPQPGDPRHVH